MLARLAPRLTELVEVGHELILEVPCPVFFRLLDRCDVETQPSDFAERLSLICAGIYTTETKAWHLWLLSLWWSRLLLISHFLIEIHAICIVTAVVLGVVIVAHVCALQVLIFFCLTHFEVLEASP